MRPTSRNCAAREGLQFVIECGPRTFHMFFEVLDKMWEEQTKRFEHKEKN